MERRKNGLRRCGSATNREGAHRGGQTRGFTLVEIIVVVIIIGVLATLIAPRLFSRVAQAKVEVARSNAATLKNAVRSFSLDCRKPRAGETLRSILWEKPSDVSAEAWANGPYIEKEKALLDPWGSEYVLQVPGEVSVDFDIVSYGADGQPGGESDNADIIE